MDELIALFSGIIFLITFIGWGKILCKFLMFKKNYENDQYLYPVLGMSLVVIIGGYLNLLQLINKFTVLVILLIGLIGSLSTESLKNEKSLFIRIKNRSILDALVLIFSSLGIVYIYIISTLNRNYNGHDDFEGYFSFASKLLQTGSLGHDPFSERRMVTSLGGQSFLDSLNLTLNSFEFLHLTDSGVGLLVLLSSVFKYYKSKNWKISKIAFIGLIISFLNPMMVNITAIYTIAATCFVLITLVLDFKRRSAADKVVLFLIVASAGITLKNTSLPIFFLLLVTYIGIVNWPMINFRKTLRNLSLGILIVILCVGPWSISLYLSNGSPLYPFLGSGFHESSYRDTSYLENILNWEFLRVFGRSIVGSLLTSPLLIILIITVFGIYTTQVDSYKKRVILFLGSILFINYCAIAIGTVGYHLYRYNFPYLLAFTLAILPYSSIANYIKLISVFSLSLSISLFSSVIYNAKVLTIFQKIDPRPIFASVSYPNSLVITSIQNTIPVNKKLLLRTGFNFLFDFNRNKILIADYPGMSSPPPGIPLFTTSDKLKSYLLDLQIPYVILQYSGLFDKEQYSDRLEANYNSWLRTEAQNAFAFQDKILELSRSNKILYRDSNFIVLELQNN